MVVAVILQINNRVTVIAVRGTQFLYDWALNLKAWHSKIVHRLGAFHHGFLREACKLLFHVSGALDKIGHFQRSDAAPIYITGHSLGGAIAAIAFGSGRIQPVYPRRDAIFMHSLRSAYAFASPRYAPFQTLFDLHAPFQYINQGDLVPNVPPGLFGYDDFLYESTLDGSPCSAPDRGTLCKYVHWLGLLASSRFLKNHSILAYRRGIKGALKSA
jgi:predicted lipase